MNKSIIEFLNLKEEDIETIHCTSSEVSLDVELSLIKRNLACPSCNCFTSKVKDTYTRKINHGIFIDRLCLVYFKQKRYFCANCNSSFNESFPLASKHQKKSLSSHMQIMELLKDPHLTFSKVGELLHLSTTTVIETFYSNLPIQKPVLPRALCIDEVYLGRNAIKKYVAVLLNFETNEIVDIIYGRTKDCLHSYFQGFTKEQLDRVEYLSSDMFEGYRFLKRHYLKNAKLCVDSFHVIQLINNMINNQVKKLMRNSDKDSIEYYLLKSKRYVLLKNYSKIDWYKREYNRKLKRYLYVKNYLDLIFENSPLLEEMYNLKEEYISFNQLLNRDNAKAEIDVLISKFKDHSCSEVRRIGRTLSKWRTEIINSFSRINYRRISNGPIESRNNIIKLIIRNAAGYHNFDHLRRRIIYCINSKKRE